MPFRLTKRVEASHEGFVVRLSRQEVEAMGLAHGADVDVELWPPSTHLDRIPLEHLERIRA